MENNACPCCGALPILYQETWHTKLYIDRLGAATILKTETNYCPPYAGCCGNDGQPRRAAFIINFCPECGRDLRPKKEGTP